jgi:hypothetical protein
VLKCAACASRRQHTAQHTSLGQVHPHAWVKCIR